jgi:hypothetical protein
LATISLGTTDAALRTSTRNVRERKVARMLFAVKQDEGADPLNRLQFGRLRSATLAGSQRHLV